MLGGVETKSFAYICALGALVALAHGGTCQFLLTGSRARSIFLSACTLPSASALRCFSLSPPPRPHEGNLPAMPSPYDGDTRHIRRRSISFRQRERRRAQSGDHLRDRAQSASTFPGLDQPWVVRFSASCMLFAGILAFSRRRRGVYSRLRAGLGRALLYGTRTVSFGKLRLLKLYWFRHPTSSSPCSLFPSRRAHE